MFAKPAAKKPVVAGLKLKTANKAKTVSVKTGVKAAQNKKTKPDGKKSLKPPPRQDAGYSLYSSDGEEQVSSAFNELETCEKILTQIKAKQKGPDKGGKTKKKKKDGSPLPKALNENPPRTDIVPGFSSIYGTTYPYGTALFLRQLQSQDFANNPLFNSRLASSTPDPEKHLADMSAGRLPSGIDHAPQDIPERDISAVSSVLPSANHLQNMANMVDIYKQLEFNKATQVQEAAARAELEKFRVFQSARPAEPVTEVKGQGQTNIQLQSEQQNSGSPDCGRESEGFVGTGSLGFPLTHGETVFRPVVLGSGSFDSLGVFGQQDSSLTAFQPYISVGSQEILPPQSWTTTNLVPTHSQGHQPLNVETSNPAEQLENGQISETEDNDVTVSGRVDNSGASKGTEYVTLPRRAAEGQRQKSPKDGKIIYEKQDGLFQLRQKKDSDTNSSCNDSKSDRSGSTRKGQSSLDEVPERDLPKDLQKTPVSPHSSKEGTFRVETQKNDSQNLSSTATSTPRYQNSSVTGSTTSSCGGRIVFIPNDSSMPSMIGYVPGPPVVPCSNQPISLPVTNDSSGNAGQGGSVVSGQQGQSTSQMTSQGPQEGSVYQSALHARAIAAGDIGVRKLRYLLKELKECTKITKDVEVNRLVTEIDEAINAIPQLALTFNLQTEIDLALQPLRSENSQLRRKLRLLNQQMKEKELANSEEPKDINFELLHLQTVNTNLQKVLKDEKEIKTRLAAEVQYLYQEIHKMKVEKSKMIAATSEKETEQLKRQQEMILEAQNLKHDLDLMRKEQESLSNRLESMEKENHILQITLKQRDEEISRQAEIVETMKESISDLLGELEQSRAGEKTWDHNTSYGLHRLIKIVEQEAPGFTKGEVYNKVQRTPERQAALNTSDSTTSTTRLTRAALAYHNRRHMPVRRVGPDGRQAPASESELDTLVEMQLKEKPPRYGQGRQLSQPRRRTSSSSPVRSKNEPHETRFGHQRTTSSPGRTRGRTRDAGGPVRSDKPSYTRTREETIGQDSDNEYSSPTRRQEVRTVKSPQRRVPTESQDVFQRRRVTEDVSPKRRVADYNRRQEASANGSEVSVEQSRYSVTDYFKKYHPHDSVVRPKEPYSSKVSPTRAKYGQSGQDFGYDSRPPSQFRTSSEIDERTAKSSEAQDLQDVRKGRFFNGMNDNQTISAIHDDDNLSSVSASSVTTANTVDDRKFRAGIATLDANIARLQQALQKTKSMLT